MNESVRPGVVVLVDTNVIIEAHRTAAWAALVGAYGVETVEDCVTETQTGYQQRLREQWIDVAVLRDSLAAAYEVADRERAELAVRVGSIALDHREESLWALALGRSGAWFFSGRTGRVCAPASGWDSGSGWCPSRNSWMQPGTDRGWH